MDDPDERNKDEYWDEIFWDYADSEGLDDESLDYWQRPEPEEYPT